MKFNLDQSTTINVVRAYGPGLIRIGERSFSRSVIVTASTLLEDWRPRRISDLQESDLDQLLRAAPRGPPDRLRTAPGVSTARHSGRALRCAGRIRGHGYRGCLPHLQRAGGRRAQCRGGVDRRTSGLAAGRIRQHEHSAKVVDVGPRRTGHHGVSERPRRSCVRRCPSRNRPGSRPRAAARRKVSGRPDRACYGLHAVNSVRVAGQRKDVFARTELHSKRQQELDIASATSRTAHGHRGLPAREQQAWGSYRPPFAHDVGHESQPCRAQRSSPRPRGGPRVSMASRRCAAASRAAASSDCCGAATT